MKSNQPHPRAHSTPVTPPGGSPSVPISVYRELAAELQATRGMVDALNQKNQQLDRENQVLRQEMQRVVQSVLTLQPWVEANRADLPAQPRPQSNGHRPTWEETAAATAIASKLRTPVDPNPTPSSPEQQFTEVPVTPTKATPTKPTGGMGGLWLTLTILVIIASAFGAGFLIMRPLLPTSR